MSTALIKTSFLCPLLCSLFWLKRKSKKSTGIAQPKPSPKKSREKPENVRYASATDHVEVGPNISYEQVEYPQCAGEIIYDHVN